MEKQYQQWEVLRATLQSGVGPRVRTGIVVETNERIHVDLGAYRRPTVSDGCVEFTQQMRRGELWPAPDEAVVLIDLFKREGEERRRANYWCLAAAYDEACAAARPKVY